MPKAAASLLKRDWQLFISLTFLFNFGFAVYGGVFQNFMRDVLHAGPEQLGNLESMREVPGLLAALTAGILVAFAESRMAALGLFICAIGIWATGAVGAFLPLVIITVFWSIGFHLYSTVSPAITLALAKGVEGGRQLGRMGAVAAVATLGALALTTWITRQFGNLYTLFFTIAGITILAGSVFCLPLSHHAQGAPRQRLILRREYSLYYLLIFLEGCRRQIFSIFASFALILIYHVDLRNMLYLQLINAVLITITAPAMGRYIDKHGERWPLTLVCSAQATQGLALWVVRGGRARQH